MSDSPCCLVPVTQLVGFATWPRTHTASQSRLFLRTPLRYSSLGQRPIERMDSVSWNWSTAMNRRVTARSILVIMTLHSHPRVPGLRRAHHVARRSLGCRYAEHAECAAGLKDNTAHLPQIRKPCFTNTASNFVVGNMRFAHQIWLGLPVR